RNLPARGSAAPGYFLPSTWFWPTVRNSGDSGRRHFTDRWPACSGAPTFTVAVSPVAAGSFRVLSTHVAFSPGFDWITSSTTNVWGRRKRKWRTNFWSFVGAYAAVASPQT